MKITARVDKGTPVEVYYDFPENLSGLADVLGDDVVYGKALDSLVIDIQALVRRHLKGGKETPPKSAEEIQAIVSAWTPGTRGPRKTAGEKVRGLVSNMSKEEKAALLASLQED